MIEVAWISEDASSRISQGSTAEDAESAESERGVRARSQSVGMGEVVPEQLLLDSSRKRTFILAVFLGASE